MWEHYDGVDARLAAKLRKRTSHRRYVGTGLLMIVHDRDRMHRAHSIHDDLEAESEGKGKTDLDRDDFLHLGAHRYETLDLIKRVNVRRKDDPAVAPQQLVLTSHGLLAHYSGLSVTRPRPTQQRDEA